MPLKGLPQQIYFLGTVGGGPIKIGCSAAPDQRLNVIAKWSPQPLELLACCPGTMLAERQIHFHFRAHWLHHEWFVGAPEILAFVERVAASGRLPRLSYDPREVARWRSSTFAAVPGRRAA